MLINGICGNYIYAMISEEQDTIMVSHGLLPLLVETEGRSRKNAEREMRKLSQAMYCKRGQLGDT